MNIAVTIAWLCVGLGGFVTGLNFYITFLRYPLHLRLRREEPYKWVSGFPVIGSALLGMGAIQFWVMGFPIPAILAVLLSLLDTGGLHAFLFSQWKERSDQKRSDREA